MGSRTVHWQNLQPDWRENIIFIIVCVCVWCVCVVCVVCGVWCVCVCVKLRDNGRDASRNGQNGKQEEVKYGTLMRSFAASMKWLALW